MCYIEFDPKINLSWVPLDWSSVIDVQDFIRWLIETHYNTNSNDSKDSIVKKFKCFDGVVDICPYNKYYVTLGNYISYKCEVKTYKGYHYCDYMRIPKTYVTK